MVKIVMGVVIGGVTGFLFYRLIGCRTGACRIIGNPYLSTIYWALLGALVANLF